MVVFDDDYIFHHGIKGQKWGVRRYQNSNGSLTELGKVRYYITNKALDVEKSLTTKPSPFVEKPMDKNVVSKRGSLTNDETDICANLGKTIYNNAKKQEPKITSDVIKSVVDANGKMYGLDNRLKQPSSLGAKIGSDSKSDKISFNDAAKNINDAIRYTAVLTNDNFFNGYNSIKQNLSDAGYFEAKCKNYFTKFQNGEVEHKAVQSTFRSPSGISFELQFQTKESQAAKELKIPLYEEVRTAGIDDSRKRQLVKEMHDLALCVDNPKNVFDIPSHSEELKHHGIKGQHWGVRNGPPYPLNSKQSLSRETFDKINDIYKKMPSLDRRRIDPDSKDGDDYYDSYSSYVKNTAYNGIKDDGFIVAEKIKDSANVDDTHGVEIGIGVLSKGKGTGTKLVKDMLDWFENQDDYDTVWWPVDPSNTASINLAIKNGFVKDPYGTNYIYATDEALVKLGVVD